MGALCGPQIWGFSQLSSDKTFLFSPLNDVAEEQMIDLQENFLSKSVCMESFAVKIHYHSEPLCAPLIEKP